MIYSASDVFCDWLDTTYCANSDVVGSVSLWLGMNGGNCKYSDEKGSSFAIGEGYIKIDTSKRFSRISTSGQALEHLRAHNIFLEYLSELSMDAHNVSRLDTALDIPADGADTLDALRKRYSVAGVGCKLGQKKLPVSYILGVREDGRETGTFYGGHRSKARTTCRIYDKAWEALSKRGERIPPTTRYEMTSRGEKGRVGPSLRDAAEPERLFWHIASPDLLQKPDNVPKWSSDWEGGWHYEKVSPLLPAEVLDRLVEFSPGLNEMILQADKMGSGGRKYLLRRLGRKLGLEDCIRTLSDD
jgi:hypothetical protein